MLFQWPNSHVLFIQNPFKYRLMASRIAPRGAIALISCKTPKGL
jgi:hypothetical protein